MTEMAKNEKNILAEADQCQYGLWVEDQFGWALSKTPTRPLTNQSAVALELQRKCPGTHSHKDG